MALSTNSVPNNNRNNQVQDISEESTSPEAGSQAHLLHLNEVAGILRIAPEQVLELSRANGELLSSSQSSDTSAAAVHFTHSDLAILIKAQQATPKRSNSHPPEVQPIFGSQANPTLGSSNAAESTEDEKRPIPLREHMAKERSLARNGYEEHGAGNGQIEDYQDYVPSRFDEFRQHGHDSISASTETNNLEIDSHSHLPTPHPQNSPATQNSSLPSTALTHEQQDDDQAISLSADQMLGEMLSTVANSQQSVLNVQDSIREMLNVIAQDNFNLKHENRKLRERMLELERVIAEHQRREETRKEMLESRMRAVEGTLSALQQQLAQLVQLQRQRIRKNWFK